MDEHPFTRNLTILNTLVTFIEKREFSRDKESRRGYFLFFEGQSADNERPVHKNSLLSLALSYDIRWRDTLFNTLPLLSCPSDDARRNSWRPVYTWFQNNLNTVFLSFDQVRNALSGHDCEPLLTSLCGNLLWQESKWQHMRHSISQLRRKGSWKKSNYLNIIFLSIGYIRVARNCV